MTTAWVPLATITLGASAGSLTLASIPQSYRDLKLVFNWQMSGNNGVLSTYNGDTGNQARLTIYAPPGVSSTHTDREVFWAAASPTTVVTDWFDYSSTDKHKVSISRISSSVLYGYFLQRWASTSGITSIVLTPNLGLTFSAGSTFSLYGSNRL